MTLRFSCEKKTWFTKPPFFGDQHKRIMGAVAACLEAHGGAEREPAGRRDAGERVCVLFGTSSARGASWKCLKDRVRLRHHEGGAFDLYPDGRIVCLESMPKRVRDGILGICARTLRAACGALAPRR